MSENLTKFVHSIKVPRLYKNAAKIVKIAIENGGSIKHLLYSTVKANVKGCYALVTKTVQNNLLLDELIDKTKLLKENPQLDVFLAKILVSELLFGNGRLQGDSKPVQTVLRYADAIFKEFETNPREDTNKSKSEILKPRYVRVNTLKATCDEVIKELRYEGWQLVSFSGSYPEFLTRVKNLQDDEFMKDLHIKDLLVFPPRTEFYRHHLYQNATLILQDKASCLPPLVLDLGSTNTVFDMCAAPGMKTTMMSALMRNKGKIHAAEHNDRRHSDLQKIVKLGGCENVETHLVDSLKVPSEDTLWCEEVDRILLDPTCSCTGMTDEARHFREPKDEEKVRRLAGYQKNLLLHALTMFPSVRRVAYSTCSTLCEENEEVVAFALRKVSFDWSVVDAFPEWPSRGSDEYDFGPKCLAAHPERDQTTGFFVAVFQRNDSSQINLKARKRKPENQMKRAGISSELVNCEQIGPKKQKKGSSPDETYLYISENIDMIGINDESVTKGISPETMKKEKVSNNSTSIDSWDLKNGSANVKQEPSFEDSNANDVEGVSSRKKQSRKSLDKSDELSMINDDLKVEIKQEPDFEDSNANEIEEVYSRKKKKKNSSDKGDESLSNLLGNDDLKVEIEQEPGFEVNDANDVEEVYSKKKKKKKSSDKDDELSSNSLGNDYLKVEIKQEPDFEGSNENDVEEGYSKKKKKKKSSEKDGEPSSSSLGNDGLKVEIKQEPVFEDSNENDVEVVYFRKKKKKKSSDKSDEPSRAKMINDDYNIEVKQEPNFKVNDANNDEEACSKKKKKKKSSDKRDEPLGKDRKKKNSLDKDDEPSSGLLGNDDLKVEIKREPDFEDSNANDVEEVYSKKKKKKKSSDKSDDPSSASMINDDSNIEVKQEPNFEVNDANDVDEVYSKKKKKKKSSDKSYEPLGKDDLKVEIKQEPDFEGSIANDVEVVCSKKKKKKSDKNNKLAKC